MVGSEGSSSAKSEEKKKLLTTNICKYYTKGFTNLDFKF